MSLIERLDFYSIPEPNSGCTLWFGALRTTPRLYGTMSCKKKHKAAHIWAWEAANGAVPAGLCVCHKCDNQACINPAHLFLGTHTENMQDKMKKGRGNQPRGEAAGLAKLKAWQIPLIRADDAPTWLVAKRFNISRSLVWAVKNRKVWAHVI